MTGSSLANEELERQILEENLWSIRHREQHGEKRAQREEERGGQEHCARMATLTGTTTANVDDPKGTQHVDAKPEEKGFAHKHEINIPFKSRYEYPRNYLQSLESRRLLYQLQPPPRLLEMQGQSRSLRMQG